MKIRIRILIGILIGIIILTGFFILSRPIEKLGEEKDMHVLAAIPVFYSNSLITSEGQVLTIFNQYFDKIIKDTKEKLQEGEAIEEAIFFKEFISIEKRSWRKDVYWLPDNKSAYVVIIPMVSKDDVWIEKDGKIFVERIKIEGLQPEQSISLPIEIKTYEDAKKYLNEKYPDKTYIYYTETKSWIKYIIDENGTVYWAGMYLDKNWVNN